MKQFQNYKRKTQIGITILVAFALTMFIPMAVVNAATSCTLPDGSAGVIQADGHTCCPSSDQSGNSSSDTDCLFVKYINPVIELLSALVGVVVVIAVIVGGIEYSSSGGDPQRAASGRKHITNALIGLFAYILLVAFLEFLVPGGSLHG